ncbi:MAG: glycosyltransferase [Clostridia bacterium]|nr:glycosyltransferase [Clostridia bacterium]
MYIFKNKKIIFCFLALLFIFCVLVIFYIFTKKRSGLLIESKLPKVSIVVPVCNSAKFLPACLNSIINQTYRNIEIICVNDGSKDNSLEILNQYKQKDKRVIIINQSNSGVSSARNSGLKKSSGKYVQFVDSDDLINFETIKNLAAQAEKFDADIVIFNKIWFNDTEIPDINQKPKYNIENSEHFFHNENENIFDKNLNIDVIHNKFYKRDFLIKNNLFFEENIMLGEDSLFCFMSFIRNNMIVIDKNIYYYHRKNLSDSLMGSATKQKWFDNHMLMLDYMIKNQDKFKFHDYKYFILKWIVIYGEEILDFGSNEEKAKNAKYFFGIVGDFLNNKDLVISKEYSAKIQKIKKILKN